MIAPRRNPSQRCVTRASLVEQAVITLDAGKVPHTAQYSSWRHSGRRPPHPRRRDCLGSDARSRRTGGTLGPLRVTSVRSVPCASRSALHQSIGLVSFSAFDIQVLRPKRAGLSRLVWSHQRGPATLPGSNRGPKLALGSRGDAMIYRTSLVAGPVGSDWRTRRLNHETLDGGSRWGPLQEVGAVGSTASRALMRESL